MSKVKSTDNMSNKQRRKYAPPSFGKGHKNHYYNKDYKRPSVFLDQKTNLIKMGIISKPVDNTYDFILMIRDLAPKYMEVSNLPLFADDLSEIIEGLDLKNLSLSLSGGDVNMESIGNTLMSKLGMLKSLSLKSTVNSLTKELDDMVAYLETEMGINLSTPEDPTQGRIIPLVYALASDKGIIRCINNSTVSCDSSGNVFMRKKEILEYLMQNHRFSFKTKYIKNILTIVNKLYNK